MIAVIVHNELKKLRLSNYVSGQALRAPGGSAPRISEQSTHECGKIVSPTHRPPLSLRRYPWHSLLLEAESTPGP